MLFSGKDMVRLLVPLIVEQLLAVLVGMVDVVMVAAVGEAAVSGVALVDSISILVIQMLACSRRSTTDGFAEQNGRDAEQSGLILLITLRFFYNDKGHREVD